MGIEEYEKARDKFTFREEEKDEDFEEDISKDFE